MKKIIHLFLLFLITTISLDIYAASTNSRNNIPSKGKKKENDFEDLFLKLESAITDVVEPNKAEELGQKDVIEKLTTEKVIQILEENDEISIEKALSKRLQAFERFNDRISLSAIPKDLLPKFPIEFLSRSELENIDGSILIELILERFQRGKLKNLYEFILKAPKKFWKIIKTNRIFLLNFSGFHIGNCGSCGRREFDPFFRHIFDPTYLKILESDTSIGRTKYSEIISEMSMKRFILQTFIHENDEAVMEWVRKHVKNVESILALRYESFPDEAPFLNEFKANFNKCYSIKIFESESTSFVFLKTHQIDFVSVSEALKLFYLLSQDEFETEIDYSKIDPNLLLICFMMNVKNDSSYSDDFEKLNDYIIWDMGNTGNIMKPFSYNSRLILTFSNTILNSYNVSMRVENAFLQSPHASTEDSFFLENYVKHTSDCLNFLTNYREWNISKDFYEASTGKTSCLTGEKADNEVSIPGQKRKSSFEELIHCEAIKPRKAAIVNEYMEKAVEKTSPSSFITPPRNTFSSFEKNRFQSINAFDQEIGAFRKSIDFSSLISSPENSPQTTEFHIEIPDITAAFLAPLDDDYMYVNYLFEQDKTDSKPVEMVFMDDMLTVIGECIKDPHQRISISIKDSVADTSNNSFKKSLSDFGRLIMSPRMKTIIFKPGPVNGFIPLPFLCPKLMGFIGAWMGLCHKYDVTVPWEFASIFKHYLFSYEVSEQEINELVELLYDDVYESINKIYQQNEQNLIDILPRVFMDHRMFPLPAPMKSSVKPFLLELRFLEAFKDKRSAPRIFSLLSCKTSLNGDIYLKTLKSAILRHLCLGKNEFLTYWRIFSDIKTSAKSNVVENLISKFESVDNYFS